jgi:hypothetical protein
VIELPTSRVTIAAPENLGDLLPGAVPPVLPFMAGFGVSCKDLDVVRALLDQCEVPNQSIEGKIVVPARAGCGTAVVFEALR